MVLTLISFPNIALTLSALCSFCESLNNNDNNNSNRIIFNFLIGPFVLLSLQIIFFSFYKVSASFRALFPCNFISRFMLSSLSQICYFSNKLPYIYPYKTARSLFQALIPLKKYPGWKNCFQNHLCNTSPSRQFNQIRYLHKIYIVVYFHDDW